MRALAVACLVVLGGPAWALTLPEHPDGPVNDYSGKLGPEAKSRLDAQLRSYEQGTTRQIAVAVFRSLDGESLEDASIRLADQWKIGGKQSSDGVLVTLFLDDHKLRIEVGYGLEGQLTDVTAARIIRDVMAPRLRAGNLEGALRAGVAAIDTAASGRAHAEGAASLVAGGHKRVHRSFLPVILFFVFAVLLTLFRWWRYGLVFTGGGSGWSGGSRWSGGGRSGGGWSGGGGSFGGGGASGGW